MYKISTRTIEPQAIASIRTTCAPAEIGGTLRQIIPEVWGYLKQQGADAVGPPFTRFHGFADTAVELEAGFPVKATIDGDGRVEPGELPGGLVACTDHIGPYDKLPDAHDAIDAWIKENNHESNGLQWEVYWDDPGEVPPVSLRTELLWPIK